MGEPRGAEGHQTASVLVLRSLVGYAGRIGMDVGGLLRTLQVPPSILDEPDARLPQSTIQRAFAAIGAASADPAFGLHLGQQTEDGEFDVLDYAMGFSSTLGEALDRVARFYRLASDAAAIEVLREAGVTRVVRRVRGVDPHDQDALFTLLTARFRRMSGRSIRPTEVSLEHPPRAQRELGAFFQCPVRFDRPVSELVFASSDLALPVRAARPRLAATLDRYAAELLERLPATGSYADNVRRAVATVIQRGPPTLEAIARELHASRRTLQRRLADAGTTHKRLVEEVRLPLALRYLDTRRLSITEVAFLLGYKDESSFRRAFKKWTGHSPAHARRH